MAYFAPLFGGPIADRFAQEVAERTRGEVKIQSFGAGQLGSLPQNYAGLRTGQIDMMLADTGDPRLREAIALFLEAEVAGKWMFGTSIVTLAVSLVLSLVEVLLSTEALSLVVRDLEQAKREGGTPCS